MELLYSFDPERFFLGTVCKRGHQWRESNQTLRYLSDKSCVECAKLRSRRQCATGYNARWNAKTRAQKGRDCRANGLHGLLVPAGHALSVPAARIARELITDGHPIDFQVLKPLIDERLLTEKILSDAIRNCGRPPSIPQLVMEEQRRYWAKDPEAYRAYSNQRRKDYHRWRMMTDPEYVLYHRQKSKRRKALLKSSVGIQLTGRQVRQRFGEFGNVCAYCGAGGVDLHIEHVVPISRGGTHTLGNIVPACQSCNFNKSTHEVEAWYRSQPFFCERRWKKVCRVLGWAKSSTGQLALL